MTVLDSDLVELVSSDSASGIGPRPEAILWPMRRTAWRPLGSPGACVAAKPRPSSTSPTTARRLRFLAGMVAFFAPEIEIVEIPAWDCLPYDRISPSAGIMAERLRALQRLAAGPGRAKRLVLTTANAIVQKVPPPERVRAAHLRAKAGARVDRDGLVAYLERNGYHRTSAVVEAGDYAVRGGLVDVFPSGHEQPVRLDFFGSTLESIRSFDPLTQRSQGKVAALELMPVSEVLLDADAVESFKSGYLRRFGAVTSDPLLESVEAGRVFPAWSTGWRCSTPTSCRSPPISTRRPRSPSTTWRVTPSRPVPP